MVSTCWRRRGITANVERHDTRVLGRRESKITDLVHIIHLDDVIKQAVEVIQEGHHLHGGTDRAHGGEAHNVREEDRYHVVALRLNWLPRHQLVCD